MVCFVVAVDSFAPVALDFEGKQRIGLRDVHRELALKLGLDEEIIAKQFFFSTNNFINDDDVLLPTPSSSSSSLMVPISSEEDDEENRVIILRAHGRLLGGKGGFGALLRGQNAKPGQKRIIDDNSASRDLNGRRLRHVENEKKLREWKDKTAEREVQKLLQQQKAREAAEAKRPVVTLQDVDLGREQTEAVAVSVTEGLKISQLQQQQEKAKLEEARKLAAKKMSKIMGALSDEDDDEEEISSSDDEVQERPAKSQRTASPLRNKEGGGAAAQNGSSEKKNEAATTAAAASDVPSTNNSSSSSSAPPAPAPVSFPAIDLEQISSVEDLVALGPDHLKDALIQRGLKCGGTCQQRAERLFSVKGKKPHEIDPKLKAGK